MSSSLSSHSSNNNYVPNLIVFVMVTLASIIFIPNTHSQLTPNFYDYLCPQALKVIASGVERAIDREPRAGASLLRLHFHDCFVNGCDGSVLLDDTPWMKGEKTSAPNNNSLRAFDVVDQIKAAVDQACDGPLVSCADILAVAARDSVRKLGGEEYWYQVLVGRRDSRNASFDDANNDLPLATASFPELLTKNFQPLGLNYRDLVALSGAHTIGYAKCNSFKSRLYNDTNIDPNFALNLKRYCPPSGNDYLTPFDPKPATFDTTYYTMLLEKRGLLHTDQELYKADGSESDFLVNLYSSDPLSFATDFGVSMVKMGNIKPLVGNDGEIRSNCRRIN